MKNRREFLKLSAGYAGLVGLSSMGIPLSLFGNDGSNLTGYKALVVILQHGGNDSLNMLVPSGDDENRGHALYASNRGDLAVANLDLPLTAMEGKLSLASNPYEQNGSLTAAYRKGFYKHNKEGQTQIDGLACNALMPELAHLANEGKVAMIANAGNLISPTRGPRYLFAHNNQRRLTFTGANMSLDRRGWAGLLADRWLGINGNSVYGMNIGVDKNPHLFSGNETGGFSASSSGPISYNGINRPLYNDWLGLEESGRFKGFYASLRKHSLATQDVINNAWENAYEFHSNNAYGEKLFSWPNPAKLEISRSGFVGHKLIDGFSTVAKLIQVGKASGLKRQIFYVQHRGYDNHSGQAEAHSSNLRELSMGIGDFQLAMQELGLEDEVTTFNMSDFGRSIGNNGGGTDHGWGAHYFAVGGAVKGGLYGTLPDLNLGGPDDFAKRGRLRPTTSLSQHFSTLVKWFGADEETLTMLFPDRVNFDEQDLGFMKSV